ISSFHFPVPRFLAPFFALIWAFWGSKTSSFWAPETVNSFVLNIFLGSFPLFSIFFLFSTHFPPALPPSANSLSAACWQVSSCDNPHRLPQLEPGVKSKVQEQTARAARLESGSRPVRRSAGVSPAVPRASCPRASVL